METAEKCNIWKQQCKVHLTRDERQCPTCKGQGATFLNASFKQRKFHVKRCSLCRGKGKVDWIQAITKKPNEDAIKGFPMYDKKYIHMKCSGHLKCKKKLKRLWTNQDNQFKKFPVY